MIVCPFQGGFMKRVPQSRQQQPPGRFSAKTHAPVATTATPVRPTASAAPKATRQKPSKDELVCTSESVSDKDEFPQRNEDGRFRKFDTAGKLVAAGYQWREFNRMVILAGFGYLPLLAWAAYYMLNRDAGPLQLFTIIGLAAVITIYISGNGFNPKAVIFTMSGAMETPFGFGNFKDKRIGGNHQNSISIEVGRYETVHLISSEGDTIIVTGQELGATTARKVAVQMTKALEEIRRAQMGPEPRTVHYTID
jgi:hypothetical protein